MFNRRQYSRLTDTDEPETYPIDPEFRPPTPPPPTKEVLAGLGLLLLGIALITFGVLIHAEHIQNEVPGACLADWVLLTVYGHHRAYLRDRCVITSLCPLCWHNALWMHAVWPSSVIMLLAQGHAGLRRQQDDPQHAATCSARQDCCFSARWLRRQHSSDYFVLRAGSALAYVCLGLLVLVPGGYASAIALGSWLRVDGWDYSMMPRMVRSD
jgi:hypothetical protein